MYSFYNNPSFFLCLEQPKNVNVFRSLELLCFLTGALSLDMTILLCSNTDI